MWFFVSSFSNIRHHVVMYKKIYDEKLIYLRTYSEILEKYRNKSALAEMWDYLKRT